MSRKTGRTLVVGTRASKLALWQTHFVVDKLTALFPTITYRIETFKTVGDDIVDRPLPELGGKGVFTARLERALLGGDVDIAVHSLKDLPIEVTPGLTLGAISSRADVRDIVVSRDGVDLASIRQGAVIGTSSLRRQAQLLRIRPDLVMKPIRGNVETRIRKVREGHYDATILAGAGVDRLGLTDAVSDRLSLDAMLPAPGQGALAIQCRDDDDATLEILRAIDDADDRISALSERAFLAGLGGGCSAPVAAFAQVEDGNVTMTGLVGRPDGGQVVVVNGSDPDGMALGARLAAQAIADGARAILDDARAAMDGKQPLAGRRIVVTRAAARGEDLCHALSGLGATPIHLPMIRTESIIDDATIARVMADAAAGDWFVFTSVNGVASVGGRLNADAFEGMRIAAVGKSTAGALRERGIAADFVPDTFTGVAIGKGMPDIAGRGVWLLRAETAGQEIVRLLEQRGAEVHDIPVYRTAAEPIDDAGLAELEKGVDAVTFTSGSTARHFKRACDVAGWHPSALIACIGPVTAETAREVGFEVGVVAEEHTASGLVDALATYYSEVS
jgi:hydroxymethylbilane synthase